MKKDIACIILAAGKGTRMNSDLPKVLHPLCGRPMLGYVMDLARELKAAEVVTVLGHGHQLIRKQLKQGLNIAVQKRLLGTADAVKQAMPRLNKFKGDVLVLYGDMPLLNKDSLEGLLRYHRENDFDATLLVAKMEKPFGYGRILRDRYANIRGIVEEKDADDFQKETKEVNTGIIIFKKDILSLVLRRIRPNNRKKEYYLTDAVRLIYEDGGLVGSFELKDAGQAQGINSRSQLAHANSVMQRRINKTLMKNGVTIIDPATAFISYGTKIGKDSVIYPFTVVERDVRIGNRCFIGPFAHLREGTRIEDGVIAGNFIETVRSRLGSKTLAKHFCYIGDSSLGSGVNIGAGTVTANFDGRKKNNTVIKKGAFVGSDTVLVAPVKIGKGSLTAAGSVVTRDVPDKTRVAGVPARPMKAKGR